MIDGYDPRVRKTGDFSVIIGELQKAEQRAENQRNLRVKEYKRDGNPSTNMYELTRALLEASKPKEAKKDG